MLGELFKTTDADLVLKICQIINYVFCVAMVIIYANQFVYIVLSIFMKPKRFKEATKEHTYGYIICGKNEQSVIGNLIESIKKQDYPTEKMHIFVCADNCTDDTAKIAREKGAIVFERFDNEHIGKSYALDYTLNKIHTEYEHLGIEAYILFDADNLASKDYTKEMNKAYDAGYLVATGFRDSKNYSKNWVTAGSSYMFYRECCQVHYVRGKLNTGTYVSGTGFLIDKSLVANGWKYRTLTEDIEFSADCARRGIKIGYVYDAIYYDEQPEKLFDSMKQRLRWCKGNNQVFGKYGARLFFGMFKKFSINKWSMFTHTIPYPGLSTLWLILHQLIGGIYCLVTKQPINIYLNEVLIFSWFTIRSVFLTCFLDVFILLFQTRKKTHAKWYKKLFYAFMFPFFMASYLPMTVIALLKKNVKWKAIKHTDTRTIDQI